MQMTEEIIVKKDRNDKKDERRKYYFVKASNICYVDENENIVTLEDAFNFVGLSPKKRFVILQKEPMTNKVKEFTTDTEFKTKISHKIGSKASIYGNSNLVKNEVQDPYDHQCYEGIYFNAQKTEAKDFEFVKKYIESLKQTGELDIYFKALAAFISRGKLCAKKRNLSTKLSGYKLTLNRSKEFTARNEI